MAPNKKHTQSFNKDETGESSRRSPNLETTTPTIPSTLILDVLKSWFENHTAFGKWIDIFKHFSLSFVDILDYTFF